MSPEAKLQELKAADPAAYEQLRNLAAAHTGERDVSKIGDGHILTLLQTIWSNPIVQQLIASLLGKLVLTPAA